MNANQLLSTHQTQCCILLRKALTPQEQQHLFDFILERDVTDWEGMTRCMNPTPKTLNLSLTVGKGRVSDINCSTRTITIMDQSRDDDIRSNRIDDTDNVDRLAKAMVAKLVNTSIAAAATSLSLADGITDNHHYTSNNIKSISLSVIRYSPQGMSSTIGHELPPHVDHCNDGSLVVLFSLGRTAHFFVSSSKSTRKEFDMHSGDVLVFDPSSEAGILHGVSGIACGSTNNNENNENIGDCPSLGYWEDSRLGVQCRVSF